MIKLRIILSVFNHIDFKTIKLVIIQTGNNHDLLTDRQ